MRIKMQKQNFEIDERKNDIKGITLIALVITIIILLLLAGISIGMLTGENGILTKATEAEEETKKSNIKEKIQLAIMGSYGIDGRIEIERLEKELIRTRSYDYF